MADKKSIVIQVSTGEHARLDAARRALSETTPLATWARLRLLEDADAYLARRPQSTERRQERAVYGATRAERREQRAAAAKAEALRARAAANRKRTCATIRDQDGSIVPLFDGPARAKLLAEADAMDAEADALEAGE